MAKPGCQRTASVMAGPAARWIGLLVVGASLLAWGDQRAAGQIGTSDFSGRYELSENVQVDQADSKVEAQLQRVEAYLADHLWDEAIETLCQVMGESSDKLLPVTPRRYVAVRDYCHLKLASLPGEALALYRGRVDPQA